MRASLPHPIWMNAAWPCLQILKLLSSSNAPSLPHRAGTDRMIKFRRRVVRVEAFRQHEPADCTDRVPAMSDVDTQYGSQDMALSPATHVARHIGFCFRLETWQRQKVSLAAPLDDNNISHSRCTRIGNFLLVGTFAQGP